MGGETSNVIVLNIEIRPSQKALESLAIKVTGGVLDPSAPQDKNVPGDPPT